MIHNLEASKPSFRRCSTLSAPTTTYNGHHNEHDASIPITVVLAVAMSPTRILRPLTTGCLTTQRTQIRSSTRNFASSPALRDKPSKIDSLPATFGRATLVGASLGWVVAGLMFFFSPSTVHTAHGQEVQEKFLGAYSALALNGRSVAVAVCANGRCVGQATGIERGARRVTLRWRRRTYSANRKPITEIRTRASRRATCLDFAVAVSSASSFCVRNGGKERGGAEASFRLKCSMEQLFGSVSGANDTGAVDAEASRDFV